MWSSPLSTFSIFILTTPVFRSRVDSPSRLVAIATASIVNDCWRMVCCTDSQNGQADAGPAISNTAINGSNADNPPRRNSERTARNLGGWGRNERETIDIGWVEFCIAEQAFGKRVGGAHSGVQTGDGDQIACA